MIDWSSRSLPVCCKNLVTGKVTVLLSELDDLITRVQPS